MRSEEIQATEVGIFHLTKHTLKLLLDLINNSFHVIGMSSLCLMCMVYERAETFSKLQFIFSHFNGSDADNASAPEC